MKRCGWKRSSRMFLGILLPLYLMGCTVPELEERTFPVVLAVRSAGIDASMEEQQSRDRNTADYGHVRHVIISRDIAADMQSMKEILEYFEKRPVFARNILVLAAGDEVLDEMERNEAEAAAAIDRLRKNDRLETASLGELLNFWHNHETVIEVPVLELDEGGIAASESIIIENGAAPAMGMPFAVKVEE